MAIARGLDFLARRQLPSGQFPVETTFHYKEGSPIESDTSPFATGHVAFSLGTLARPEAASLVDRAVAYLRNEMSPAGLWRYWNRDTVWDGRRVQSFIPADLDDTASYAYLLRRHGVAFPDSTELMLHNRDGRGLFYTWFVIRPRLTADWRYWRAVLSEATPARLTLFWSVTEAGYNDVDAVVNANVLLYLGNRPETRPVVDWLVRVVREGREADSDKWYRDIYTFYYALARCHEAGVRGFDMLKATVHDRLAAAAHPDGRIGDHALHTALAVNTLAMMNIDAALGDRAVAFLLASQHDDGSWSSAPYYYGGPKRAVSWGCRELTTGICLEAIHRAAGAWHQHRDR